MIQGDSIQVLIDNYECLRSLVEVSNSTIANELSAASHSLNIFSWVIAITGVSIGAYVTFLFYRVKKIKSEVVNAKQYVDNTKKCVVEIDSQIQSNLEGLYKRLREEETKTLIARLVEEPLDLPNIENLLLSRNIDDSLFPLLKEAFINLLKTGREDEKPDPDKLSFKKGYLLLFFQHFFYNSILDDDLRDFFPSFYSDGMYCEFKRDIIKTTEDLCKALSLDAVPFDREFFLYVFLVALNSSKFKKLIELKNILESQIKNKTILPATIERAFKNNITLDLFVS